MNPEDLLKMLRDNGLQDDVIQKLLSDSLASLQGPAEEEMQENEDEEKEAAGKLLGVSL